MLSFLGKLFGQKGREDRFSGYPGAVDFYTLVLKKVVAAREEFSQTALAQEFGAAREEAVLFLARSSSVMLATNPSRMLELERDLAGRCDLLIASCDRLDESIKEKLPGSDLVVLVDALRKAALNVMANIGKAPRAS